MKNLSKSEFKKKYSAYRKELSSLYSFGTREQYCEYFGSDDLFCIVKSKHVFPTSLKIYLYKCGRLTPELRSHNISN
jgi:hypothetical protein